MLFRKFLTTLVIFIAALLVFSACNKEEEVQEPEKITFKTVNGFIINEKGEKFLATDNGLFLFNKTEASFDFVGGGIQLSPLNDLNYSRTSSNKDLWLASNFGALNFTSQEPVNTANSELYDDMIHRLGFDEDNRIYFTTPDRISIYDNKKWWENKGMDNLFSSFKITDIASAINGYMYVTTNGGGIERFEMGVDGVSGATIFDTDWTKLESNNINTVFIDSITQVYGTDAGVAIHFSEFTKWDWQTYSTNDGLINNDVISVLKDDSDNWWFGTILGLSRFDNSTWTNFTVETHGILSNNIKFLALDIDGSVWFATDSGLSQFVNNQWINYTK